MDLKKANLEICRAIADGKLVRGGWIQVKGKKYYFAINEKGYYGYFIPYAKIVFNTSLIMAAARPISELIDMKIVRPENEIKVMNALYCTYMHRVIRKFKTSTSSIFIDTAFLKCLDLDICHFYQDKNNNKSKVIVVENDSPVMVVCPTLYSEEEE